MTFNSRVVTVDALVIHEKKILLIQRGHAPEIGTWALPGGHLDRDETAEMGVLRELQEETGLVGADPMLLGVFTAPDRDPEQKVSIAYLIRSFSGQLKAGDDAVGASWFELDQLPSELAFDHGQMIRDVVGLTSSQNE